MTGVTAAAWDRRLRWASLAVALGAVLTLPLRVAAAGDLYAASNGYVYFHKAGETMASHDEAVDEGVQLAGGLAKPGYGSSGLVASLLSIPLNNALFRANLENCMV